MFNSPFAEDAQEWTVEDALEKLAGKKWKIHLKTGVKTNLEKILEKPVCNTQHKLGFETPTKMEIHFKVQKLCNSLFSEQ